MTNTNVEESIQRALAAYGTEADLYRNTGEWTNQTIIEVIRGWAYRRPNALAVGTVDGALTYEELDLRSDAAALGLLEAGLEPRAPVLFQMGNELETVIAFYAVLKVGAVPVCSIPNHRLHELSLIATATGARGHIFQADYRSYDLESLSSELEERCPQVRVRVMARGTPSKGALSLHEIMERSDAKRAREMVDAIQKERSAEEVAIFQLSGGTTGIPKVIPHTHATYLSIAARWSANLEWDEECVNLHFIPIMHHAGLGTMLTPTHFCGGNVVLSRSVDAKLIVNLIERYGVTCMHFNVAAAHPVLEYSQQRDCDFSSLTHFICTWAAARPELATQVEQLFGAVGLGSFGMGEGVHTCARRDDPVAVRRSTVGSAIGRYDEVVIRRPGTDEVVADGEIGEFTFRGPSVIRSYLNQELSATAFTSDGFLRSGDLGCAHTIEGRRCFTLEGRIKDQINRGGEKFMANELEILLQDHPDVREVAAFGLPDAKLGERVCVAVVLEAATETVEAEELRQELVKYLDQRDVAKFKWPEKVVLLDELPKTQDGGKVKKDILRDQVASDMAVN